MSSVTPLSNASGLTLLSVAQAKSQNLLDNFTSKQQAVIASAPKSFVMTLSSSGFQAAIVSNAVNADTTLTVGGGDYAAFYNKYDGMSSADWSSMLYAGGAVLGNPEEKDSANTLESSLTQSIASEKAIGDAGTDADAAIDQQALAAFNNKTLTIQKASDVAGLDWKEAISISSTGNGGGVMQDNTTYNWDFVKANIGTGVGTDGKMHEMIGMGPTELYLSW